MSLTYKDAGVDIDKGDAFVEKIKNKVKSTYGDRVLHGVGGFACLYEVTKDKYLAAGTDGVGTKLMIAQQLNIHNTIGIDLVAMCVNDVICTGASPLFFMDYLACGELDVETSTSIIDGVVEGCLQSEMALIGGETAEMPGMYKKGDYDLAGFAIGEVSKESLVDGSKIREGDAIIGLASSGIHSNGYSLVRKLFKEDETELLKECLTPTRIYVKVVKQLTQDHSLVNGMAHITGGGVHNIARLNKDFNYHINQWIPGQERAKIYDEIESRGQLSNDELYKTFNMGIGYTFITSQKEKLINTLNEMGEKPYELGVVTKGKGEVVLNF